MHFYRGRCPGSLTVICLLFLLCLQASCPLTHQGQMGQILLGRNRSRDFLEPMFLPVCVRWPSQILMFLLYAFKAHCSCISGLARMSLFMFISLLDCVHIKGRSSVFGSLQYVSDCLAPLIHSFNL